MADIVETARTRASSYRMGGPSSEHTAALLDELADTITALRAENERLRAAIEDTLNKARDANKTYVELFVEVCCELRAALEGKP